MIKGITKSGFEFEVNESIMNDMEVVDALVDIKNQDMEAVSVLVGKLFNREDKKRLYNHVRTEDGRAPIDAVMAEVNEIIQYNGEEGKN